MIPREARTLVGALALLVIAGALLVFTSQPQAPALSTRSDAVDGAMVLRQWLEAVGHGVREVRTEPVQLDDLDVLFVLGPQLPYSEASAVRVREWVEAGGTLIVAGQSFTLLDAFGLSMIPLADREENLIPAAPTLFNPPFDPLRADAWYAIIAEPDLNKHMVVHFASEVGPVMASLPVGRGEVWVSGATRPFTNGGLQDPGSPELILNMLSSHSRAARIGFDEARHGFIDSGQTLTGWLTGTAPGWGVLSAVLLTFVFLALRGRRFGRPIPLPDERPRREPVEYITAVANLYRRSGQRDDLLAHYRRDFERNLTTRYNLPPDLNTAEIASAIHRQDATVDEAELRALLLRLSQKGISEAALVQLVADVTAWWGAGKPGSSTV